jgi:hypothetical protein
MPIPFYERLASYYEYLGGILRAEKKLASIFPNNADIGWIRESQYAKILANHLPDGCNILFGGFLFDKDGSESRQTDIIICSDTIPQFKVEDKSFAPIDGTIAVVEVKSNLTKEQLIISLDAFAALPTPSVLEDWQLSAIHDRVRFNRSDPFLIIFAYDGIDKMSIHRVLTEYYTLHPEIPIEKRPNMIHICGKSFTLKTPMPGTSAHEFVPFSDEKDIKAFSQTFIRIQELTGIHRNVLWKFQYILSAILSMPGI